MSAIENVAAIYAGLVDWCDDHPMPDLATLEAGPLGEALTREDLTDLTDPRNWSEMVDGLRAEAARLRGEARA